MTAPARSLVPFTPDPESDVEAGPRVTRTPAEDERIARAVNDYFELVWRSVRRFGVPDANADDAAQSAFLIFARRIAHIELGRERSFLVGIAVRVAANYRRQRSRSREELPDSELEETSDDENDPEQLLNRKQRRAELDRALAHLPLEQRVVFVLYELEGFCLPEIASSLGIPLGTATSRLGRARERFEHWVAEHHSKKGSQ